MDVKELEKNLKGIKSFALKMLEAQKKSLSPEDVEKLESHLSEIKFEETLNKVDKSLVEMKKAINGR